MTINNEVRSLYDLMEKDLNRDERNLPRGLIAGTDGHIEEEYKRSIILDSNFTSIEGIDASVLLADSSDLFIQGSRILENKAAGSTLALTYLRAMFNNTIFYRNVAK